MGRVSDLITLDILQEVLSSKMKLRKEIKGTQIVKKIIKPPLCVDDINYYTEIPLHSTKQKNKSTKTSEANEFSKNPLYFYILIMKRWKSKLKAQYYL